MPTELNITGPNNDINISTTENQVVVSDALQLNDITITQPITSVVEIYTGTVGATGPQGPAGPSGSQGPAVDTGSFAITGSNTFNGTQIFSGSINISGSATLNSGSVVSSNTVQKIETLTSASYAAITPVSGTLYIIIG